jgi:DNA polymerase-3 subunit beta
MWTISTFQGSGKGEFLIPYKPAMDVLSGETGPLEIDYTSPKKSKNPKESVDGHTVKLSVGGCEFTLNTMNITNFPQTPDAAPAALTIGGKEFRTLLDHVLFAISKEEYRYTLNGALLTTARDVVRLIATDGHRLSLAELPMEGVKEFKALIPNCGLDYLKARSNGKVEIGTDQENATFYTGNVTMIVRLLKGQFPNYEAVMPTELPITAKVDGNITKNLAKVAKCADERSGAVKFSFLVGEQSFISAESTERGKAKAPLMVISDGAVVIGLNANYILEFLKVAGDAQVEIGLRDPESAVMFSTENRKYVVMPMRM